MRKRSTNRSGGSFGPLTVQNVWNKGRHIPGEDPDLFRFDSCGARMSRWEYGNVNSSFGWEVDHIKPVSKGGSDDLSNLQPLQWENNRAKGDEYPHRSCAVKWA